MASPAQQPVEFNRVFVKGETATYKVHSQMTSEQRTIELETWMPSDLDIVYTFDYEVTEMKADGICVLRYRRPEMTEVTGETADAPPRRKVEKTNLDFILTVSPINEILDLKEAPKPPAKPPARRSGGGSLLMRAISPMAIPEPQVQQFIGQFVGEIYRLALFVGSMDSSMDFAPVLPVTEVVPGDTWKKTVGFQPQRVKGKGNKMAVQRLDYTFTYKGVVTVNGKQYQRIEADLKVKSDLAEFIHQTFNAKPEETGLKEIPLGFDAKVLYDLDMKTHQTIRAVGSSEGGFSIVAQGFSKPVQEERFKASSTLSLLKAKRP